MSASADGARPRTGVARRLVRSPLVHLAVAGGLLLGARARLDRPSPPAVGPAERAPIVVTAAKAATLESEFTRRWGRAPNAGERAALVEQSVQDEMLYREARVLALGLDDASVQRRLIELLRAVGERPDDDPAVMVRRAVALGLDDDVVIRRLLTEKMRLVLQRDQGAIAVSDADLERLRERDRSKLLQPATITLTQVFVGNDRRGDDGAKRDAAALLVRLRSAPVTADDAVALSDPLPIGGTLRGYSRAQVQGRFGKEFADAVFALDAGTWSEPIASPFGLHLVRVEERLEERLPPLDELRPGLVASLRHERARDNLARGLQRLRALYEVRIEDAATHEASAGGSATPS